MALEKGTRLLLWITGLGVLIFTAAIVAVVLIVSNDTPKLAQGEWLEMHLGGVINDGPLVDELVFDPANKPLTAHEYSAALHHAANDPNVGGLALILESPQLGMAKAQEIRGGLVALREAGKPCKVWSKTYDNVGWYVASACDEVHLHPEGVPMAIGLSITTSYYAGTFEKLGVSGDFERVGDYKSAIETYELTGPSEPSIEMYDSMLDAMYLHFTTDIANGRGVSVDEIAALVDDPPMTAQDAVARGMIDSLTYLDEFMDAPELEEAMPIKRFASKLKSSWTSGDTTVAVVHLTGQIIDGESTGGGLFGGSVIGDESVVPMLNELAEDDNIDAVVLRIDSPGGSALASDVMWRAIVKLDEKKPVIASMGTYAASGGYYLAMAARKIVAQPSTLTGSIGVFGGKFALSGLYEKAGVTHWTSKRGELSGLFNTNAPFTDAERAKIRERMLAFYTTFVGKAAEGRGMSFDEIDAVAGGRVWTGAQALDVGLVDELGGIEEAVRMAADAAGASADSRIGRQLYPRSSTLLETLLKSMGQPTAQAELQVLADTLGEDFVAELVRARALADAVEAGGGVVAMDPVRIQVR